MLNLDRRLIPVTYFDTNAMAAINIPIRTANKKAQTFSSDYRILIANAHSGMVIGHGGFSGSNTIVNALVSSRGGQWAVQGPIMIQTALDNWRRYS